MDDEKYVYISDLRDKKITARSARSKRTHNGKGGRVRFPSDNLTRKELQAMNGEVKSYRLNEPMSWREFKTLPNDLKVCYITALRERYNVSDGNIAKMFGTSPQNFGHVVVDLGCSKKTRGSKKDFDAEAWFKFVNGIKETKPIEPLRIDPLEAPEVNEPCENETNVQCCPVPERSAECNGEGAVVVNPHTKETTHTATPYNGNVVFECPANQALNMMAQILGNTMVHISFAWDVIDEEKGVIVDG